MKKFIKLLVLPLSLIGITFTIGVNNNRALAKSDSYYAGLNMNLKGEAFIQDLSEIINTGARIGSYDSVWSGLGITDEDPNNKNNILCFYTNESIPKSHRDGKGSHSVVWNREHIWAQSHGIKSNGFDPHNDLHHLRASEKAINGARGNLDFANVSEHGGATKRDLYGNQWNSTCFEPRDAVKGDVARQMFYMTTMYSGSNGFDLDLVDRIPTKMTDKSKVGQFGSLKTLLEWHIEDPVDDIEIKRNEKIYNIQHNRNPYIDHPEYVNNAFNVNLDIPTDPEKPDPKPNPDDVNYENVNAVISLIDMIPDIITLNDEVVINNAKAVYDTLTIGERKLITNYEKLTKALSDLDKLKNPDKPEPKPDPEYTSNINIDMKNHNLNDIPYKDNLKLKINDYSFNITSGGVYSGELRIGKKSTRVPSIYKINEDGVALEGGFFIENLSKVSFKTLNRYGKLTGYHLFIGDNSGKVREVKGGRLNDSKAISVDINLDSPVSGRPILIFTGSDIRLVLDTLDFYVGDTKPNPNPEPQPEPEDTTLEDSFLKEASMSSLDISYNINTLKINNIDFHIGGSIKESSYSSIAKYGVILTDIEIIEGKHEGSISDILNINEYKEIKPAKLKDGSYELDLEIKSIADINTIYNTCLYMEYKGNVYFTEINKISVAKTAKKYIDNNLINDNNLLAILKDLSKEGYNA